MQRERPGRPGRLLWAAPAYAAGRPGDRHARHDAARRHACPATIDLGLVLYRRIRGSSGRQPWRPTRTLARVAVLGPVLVSLAFAAVYVPGAAFAVGGGAGIRAALGVVALQRTRVQWHGGARTFVPDPWSDAALPLLLAGRLAWRMAHGGFAAPGASSSPLTLLIAASVATCHLVHGSGSLLRMRGLAPP